jgi:hypothetical protein
MMRAAERGSERSFSVCLELLAHTAILGDFVLFGACNYSCLLSNLFWRTVKEKKWEAMLLKEMY